MQQWLVRNINKERLLDDLLLARAVPGEKREAFLCPEYDRDTHDPFLFGDMKKVAKRLKRAIDKNEKIVVFGDYDADGTGGAVVMHDFFARVGFQNFIVYIPDRYKEGYGLKMRHVRDFIRDGARVIITIDCGVTSYNEIQHAKEKGVDVIVLDHHIVPPQWPPAYAIINPKKDGETYPYKYVCGTALAFKVVDAMAKLYDWGLPEGWQKWLLDVVAIATVADMVPLTGENRVLLSYGIRVLKKTRRKGLRALYKKARTNPQYLTADDIGFMIGPRINAASRLAHAMISYGLLTTDDDTEAERLASRLESINEERKKTVENIVSEAHGMISGKRTLPPLIFTGNASWHPGVLGIVANRLLESYRRPAFVWGGGDGDYKGSCRAGEGVNVVDLMRDAGNGLLLDFGGHAASGGFSLEPKCVAEFERKLTETLSSVQISAADSPFVLDGQLELCDVNETMLRALQQLEPFGRENPQPKFLFQRIRPADVRELGNSGRGHLKFTFYDGGRYIPAIGFSLGSHLLACMGAKTPLDLAASIEENYWHGKRELRLRIHGVRRSEDNRVQEISSAQSIKDNYQRVP